MWAASLRCSSAKRREVGRSFSITPVDRRPVLRLIWVAAIDFFARAAAPSRSE